MGPPGLIWRGEAYDVDLGQPVGHEPGFKRPAVVISADLLGYGPGGLRLSSPSRRRPTGYGAGSSSSLAIAGWSVSAMHPAIGSE